jgi:hypothetical protein
LKCHLRVIFQNCGFIFPNGEIVMDKIFHSITSTGHRAHRELATHKQRAALQRSRSDRQMEMSAPTLHRRPALFGEWMVQMGLRRMYDGESSGCMTRERESHGGTPELCRPFPETHRTKEHGQLGQLNGAQLVQWDGGDLAKGTSSDE